jgi:hypothetical protein
MPTDGTRRSGRVSKQIAISLFGSDIEGRVFSERTKTVVLSRHGAGIVSAYKLSAEQELVIRSEASHKEIEARVVGQIGSQGKTYIYGIAFLDPDVNFWDIDFPELSETEKLASRTLLECSSCQSRETADHSDLAADVMAVNAGIVRYCKKCGSSTLWKQAAPGSTPSANLDEAARPGSSPLADSFGAARRPETPSLQERTSSFAGAAPWTESETAPAEGTAETVRSSLPVNRGAGILPAADRAQAPKAESPSAASNAGVAVKERENRRKHVRTHVNFKACVRRQGMADDVVACEDMSRGGLRFKSNVKYFEKMLIDVAVPYSPGGQAIFVPAQIAYVQELPEQNMYRCGVMYLRGRSR